MKLRDLKGDLTLEASEVRETEFPGLVLTRCGAEPWAVTHVRTGSRIAPVWYDTAEEAVAALRDAKDACGDLDWSALGLPIRGRSWTRACRWAKHLCGSDVRPIAELAADPTLRRVFETSEVTP